MILLLAAILGLIYTDVVGYFSHWLLHSGKIKYLYNLHMEHHNVSYPTWDLRSETYRVTPQWKILGAGPEWATPIGTAMWLTVLGMYLVGIPFSFILVFMGSALLYAFIAYSWLHDQFHLTGTFLLRFEWFKRMRVLHDEHHFNMKKNYGIGTFWMDKLFKTFKQWQIRAIQIPASSQDAPNDPT
jgi:sterol desaturase/sphingolipid hydroxylase (fatty acid hydroxylase superfamily)